MAKKSRGRGPMKVLFIGNSFTARNDLPGLIARLAEVRGKALEHRLIQAGGASLRAHWNAGRCGGGHSEWRVRCRRAPGAEHAAGQERGPNARERSHLRRSDQGRRREDGPLYDMGTAECPRLATGDYRRVHRHRERAGEPRSRRSALRGSGSFRTKTIRPCTTGTRATPPWQGHTSPLASY